MLFSVCCLVFVVVRWYVFLSLFVVGCLLFIVCGRLVVVCCVPFVVFF